MEKRRMNLPTGPDTLCFDKDEFMKVRDNRRGGCRRGHPTLRPCGSQGTGPIGLNFTLT